MNFIVLLNTICIKNFQNISNFSIDTKREVSSASETWLFTFIYINFDLGFKKLYTKYISMVLVIQ